MWETKNHPLILSVIEIYIKICHETPMVECISLKDIAFLSIFQRYANKEVLRKSGSRFEPSKVVNVRALDWTGQFSWCHQYKKHRVKTINTRQKINFHDRLIFFDKYIDNDKTSFITKGILILFETLKIDVSFFWRIQRDWSDNSNY